MVKRIRTRASSNNCLHWWERNFKLKISNSQVGSEHASLQNHCDHDEFYSEHNSECTHFHVHVDCLSFKIWNSIESFFLDRIGKGLTSFWLDKSVQVKTMSSQACVHACGVINLARSKLVQSKKSQDPKLTNDWSFVPEIISQTWLNKQSSKYIGSSFR